MYMSLTLICQASDRHKVFLHSGAGGVWVFNRRSQLFWPGVHTEGENLPGPAPIKPVTDTKQRENSYMGEEYFNSGRSACSVHTARVFLLDTL